MQLAISALWHKNLNKNLKGIFAAVLLWTSVASARLPVASEIFEDQQPLQQSWFDFSSETEQEDLSLLCSEHPSLRTRVDCALNMIQTSLEVCLNYPTSEMLEQSDSREFCYVSAMKELDDIVLGLLDYLGTQSFSQSQYDALNEQVLNKLNSLIDTCVVVSQEDFNLLPEHEQNQVAIQGLVCATNEMLGKFYEYTEPVWRSLDQLSGQESKPIK